MQNPAHCQMCKVQRGKKQDQQSPRTSLPHNHHGFDHQDHQDHQDRQSAITLSVEEEAP